MDLLFVSVGIVVFLGLILYSLNRDFIKLHWVKFYNGKYSYEYTQFHKEITSYNPYNHGIKDDPQNHYRNFFKDDSSCLCYNVNEVLEFSQEEFFVSEKAFLSQRSSPDAFNAEILNNSDNNLHVYGYNSTFFGKDINVHYYFVDKEMFMGEFVFVNLDISNIDTVSSIIQKKYFREIKVENEREFMIKGANQTKVHFVYNGFDLSIRYFSGQNKAINEVLSKSLDFAPEENYLEDELQLTAIL